MSTLKTILYAYFNMVTPSKLLFINTNYFSWKSNMEDLLRSKGLYQITLGIEEAPTNAEKRAKWDNRNDKACGLTGMSISPYLWFYIHVIDDLDEVWEKLKTIFYKPNIIRSHQRENQIMASSPNNFSSIEYYLSTFKTLKHLLKDCQVNINYEFYIYIILSELGSTFFVSTFMPLEKL